MNTRNLSEYGYRELDMAGDLLKAIGKQGLPNGFNDDGVTVEFNPNSGYVFLVNDDDQTAMMNGDKLEHYLSCGYCGAEGFKEDFESGEATNDPHTIDEFGTITHDGEE